MNGLVYAHAFWIVSTSFLYMYLGTILLCDWWNFLIKCLKRCTSKFRLFHWYSELILILSPSESCQMVDRLDDGSVAAKVGPLDYKGLYKAIYLSWYFFSTYANHFCPSLLTVWMLSRLLGKPCLGPMLKGSWRWQIYLFSSLPYFCNHENLIDLTSTEWDNV